MRTDKKRNFRRIFPRYQFNVMIKTLKYIDLKYLKFIFSEIGKIDLINEFPSVCIRISLRFKKKERVSVIEFVYLWSESFDTIN